MSKYFDELLRLRDSLSSIPGVKTCKIGIESGISPDDYPMIRISFSEAPLKQPSMAPMRCIIAFGVAVDQSSQPDEPGGIFGLEKAYSDHFNLCDRIIDKMKADEFSFSVDKLIGDEDEIAGYKLANLVVDIAATRY